jgi:hypothetical protein
MSVAFERLLGQLQPLWELDEPQPLDLNMGGVSFAGPTAIALIQACLRRIEADTLISGGRFALPKKDLTQRYLLRNRTIHRYESHGSPRPPNGATSTSPRA